MTSHRIGFSFWQPEDAALAAALWGDAGVARYITAAGVFSPSEIAARLESEIESQRCHGVQYWPIFTKVSGDFIGCCGLHFKESGIYELGFHLRPAYWGMGLGYEAASAVIDHAFCELKAHRIRAGHNPGNSISARLIKKLGFTFTEELFYEPTGLMHPSYELLPDGEKGV